MKIKKLLVLILSIITIIMCVCFAGCKEASDYGAFSNEDFEVVSSKIEFDNVYVIMYHRETKVMYLFVKGGYAGGLTVMVDENGKPLLYEGD